MGFIYFAYKDSNNNNDNDNDNDSDNANANDNANDNDNDFFKKKEISSLRSHLKEEVGTEIETMAVKKKVP